MVFKSSIQCNNVPFLASLPFLKTSMEHIRLELTEHDAWDHYLNSILQILAAAILFWDHLVTLGTEIEYIWMRPKSRSTIIFLAFRYLNLASMLSMLVLSFCPIHEAKATAVLVNTCTQVSNHCYHTSCFTFALFRQVVLLISQAAAAGWSPSHHIYKTTIPSIIIAILAIRIYALYDADRRIVWLSGAMVVVAAGLSGYALSAQDKLEVSYPLQFGCSTGVLHQKSLRIAGLWIILFVYDAILFTLTASRTYRVWRENRCGNFYLGVVDRPSLLSLFFKDGVMYFVVMAVATLANILTFYLGGPFLRGGLSSFASCTSATMLCRIMLNLYETASAGLNTPATLVSWKVGMDNGDEDLDAEAAVVTKIPAIDET
ncbi:hypothetical protein VNI00_003841 [Paramarasmius palmivorus]|uniref:DUF6533 domain-containing protein n=1 Tax=Paramarasmius palmivorus TaxID=297713 RepID=A0AAW0DKI2_9AGAR